MANFCPSCGKPLAPEAGFCAHCGSRLAAGAPAPPQAVSPAPAAKGSGLGKILLIVVLVLGFLGVAVVGGVVYVGYKIKNKAESVAQDMGLNQPQGAYGPALRRTADVCSLLSKDELQEIMSLPIVRADREGNSCTYYGEAAATAAGGEAKVKESFEKLQKSEPKSVEDAKAVMEQLTKGLAGAAAATGSAPGGAVPVLKITVNWGEAKSQEAAFKIAMKGLTAGLPGKYMENIPDLGDRAYSAPMGAAIFVVKGDAWIEVDSRVMATREQAIAAAEKLLSRL
ncbi:MAG: zinc ribbon domain-containing protein [Candidatus Solibacter usitatus]|nr:zinc ribbon domain-containing protein [Candidatus Solibacter usitatus]